MPTKKTIFWIGTAGALYLIAWNVGGGWLYAIIAILVAFPLGSLAISRYNTASLTVEQSGPDSGIQGEKMAAEIVITNRSPVPRYLLRIDSTYAGGSASALVLRLAGRERMAVNLEFSETRRGIYHGGTVAISSKAPIGLARSRRVTHTDCPTVIYPRWHPLSGDWDGAGRTPGYAASALQPVRSPSSDYLGVREYRPGDSPRSIHWKTSARSNRLAAIEYSRQATLAPVFIIDTYRDANVGEAGESSFETAVSLAASLVQREAALNRRFGYGTSLDEESILNLGHSAEAAMLMLAGLQADDDKPVSVKPAVTGRTDITPVLIVTNHLVYQNIARSEMIEHHPGTLVLMIDGRTRNGEADDAGALLDDYQLTAVEEELAAAGCEFKLLVSAEDANRCLESL